MAHQCLVLLMLVLLALMVTPVIAQSRRIVRPNDGQSLPVNEGLSAGTEVTTVSTTNSGNLAQVVLVSVTDGGGADRSSHFRMDNLRLLTNLVLDHETIPSYQLVIEARWTQGTTASVTCTVTVNDLQDGIPVLPADPTLYTKNFAEEQNANTEVFPAFTVTDPDSSTFTFSLTGTHASSFNVNCATGAVSVKSKLDRDAAMAVKVFSMVLNVVDPDGNAAVPKSLTVNLLDINDNNPVCDPNLYSKAFTSVPSAGTLVATLSCTDADDAPNDIVSYAISSGDDNVASGGAKFSMTGANVVTSAVPLDPAVKGSYSLTIQVSDGGTPTPRVGVATVNVQVTGVSPQWGTFVPAGPGYQVSEVVTSGSVVVTLTATDSDPGDAGVVEYYLVSAVETGTANDKSSTFSLNPTSGVLTTASGLDYESVQSYTLQVQARDKGNPVRAVGQTLTVQVTNANDNAPAFGQASYTVTVPEGVAKAGTWAGLQLTATDADSPGATLLYQITAGNSGSKFSFSGSTAGLLGQQSVIDVDTPTEDPYFYTLTVTVSDGGVPGTPVRYGTAAVAITINTNSNDYKPVFGSPVPSASPTISETAPVGTTVATLPVTDRDRVKGKAQTLSYSITGGNTNSAFSIDAVRGVVTTKRTLDYESVQSYSLTVRVADDGGPVGTATLVLPISVTNANDHIPTCQNYNLVATVVEEGAAEQVLAPSCSDADTGDTVTYAIVPPVSDLTINTSTGMVSTLRGLDYEARTSYSLTIQVSDSLTPRAMAAVKMTVQVKPVNEFDPEFSPPSYSLLLAESVGTGASVTTVTATDADKGELHGTIRYSIVAGNDLLAFTIDSGTGKITTTAAGLDREQGSGVHTLTVSARDDIPGSASERTANATVVVTLDDVNDNTPMCTPVDYQARVMEPSSAGVTVLTLTVRDDDKAGTPFATPSVTVTGGDTDSVFGTRGLSLVLLKVVNFEVKTFYSLTLTVKDGGTPPLSSTCKASVTILSRAEHPPNLTLPNHSTTIPEDTPTGTTVFDADASDLDVGAGATVTYIITSGNDNGDFHIFPTTGAVIIWNPLNYDILPRSYNLTIEARDDGGLTDVMWLEVVLSDVNDEVPVFTRNQYGRHLREDTAVGSGVVTVRAEDKDSGVNGAVTYSAVSGNGLNLFVVDGVTGVVTTNATFDREAGHFYSLVVRAADGGNTSLSSTAHVIVLLTDVNDHTPTFAPSRFVVSVSEGAAVGSHVTSVAATDGDATAANNVIAYVFLHSHFELNVTSKALTTRQALDRETTDRYQLRVLAVDNGAPSLTGTAFITVNIDDVNDNTPVISGTYVTQVSEAAIVNTVVITVNATDADAGENARLAYVIVGGNTDGDFMIAEENGIIQVARALDRERTEWYSLGVEVRDHGNPGLTASVTVNITINDDNDNAPRWTGAPYAFSVAENAAVGWSVGKVSATDADKDTNSALTYSVVLFWTGNASHLTLDGATGVLSTAAMLDRESIASYSALLRVTDAGKPQLHADVNVSVVINDVNDNTPTFNQASYTFTVTENEPVGTQIHVFNVTDRDTGVNDDVTLAIDNSTAAGQRAAAFFEITSTGALTVKQAVDREADPSFQFVVVATDGGSPSLTSSVSVVIIVNDVNDNAPVFTQTYYNTEIAYFGHCSKSIVTLTATDADTGVRGQVSYFLQTSDLGHPFGVNSQTGEFHTQPTTYTQNALHLVRVAAQDGGTPSLTSPTPALVRVDAMVPDEVVIVFHLGISADAFRARQQAFLQQLQTVTRQTHPTALARLWCVSDEGSSRSNVYVYFLKDNSTESVANSNGAKVYLGKAEARRVFTSDLQGSPGIVLKGAEWAPFNIQAVQPYTERLPAWHDTPEGVAFIVLACVLGAVLLGLAGYLLFIRGRSAPAKLTHPVRKDPRPLPRKKPLTPRRPMRVRAQTEERVFSRRDPPAPRPEGLPSQHPPPPQSFRQGIPPRATSDFKFWNHDL